MGEGVLRNTVGRIDGVARLRGDDIPKAARPCTQPEMGKEIAMNIGTYPDAEMMRQGVVLGIAHRTIDPTIRCGDAHVPAHSVEPVIEVVEKIGSKEAVTADREPTVGESRAQPSPIIGMREEVVMPDVHAEGQGVLSACMNHTSTDESALGVRKEPIVHLNAPERWPKFIADGICVLGKPGEHRAEQQEGREDVAHQEDFSFQITYFHAI